MSEYIHKSHNVSENTSKIKVKKKSTRHYLSSHFSYPCLTKNLYSQANCDIIDE